MVSIEPFLTFIKVGFIPILLFFTFRIERKININSKRKIPIPLTQLK